MAFGPVTLTAKIKFLRKPVDSIREAVFTVSPNKQ